MARTLTPPEAAAAIPATGVAPNAAPPTPGVRDDVPVPWEPFDPTWCRAVIRDTLDAIARVWFRVRLLGGERIPPRGPVILAANHSGNAFPWDGMMLDAHLWERDAMRAPDKLRTVYEHQLSLKWWMRPFGLHDFWRRAGGVDMTFDNFERLLARGDRVLYFPEGVPGIGKGFHRRYRLTEFKTSFVVLAARHRVPVVPIYAVNAEWVHPFGYPIHLLDRVMQRVFGVPFFPLPLGLLAIVQPWFFWLAFPAHMTFVVGEALDVAGALRAEGVEDAGQADRAALRRAAARLRAEFQQGLDAAVRQHGRRPYDVRSLWTALRQPGVRWWRVFPTGWPVAFVKDERDRHRAPARGRLHALLRDLDLAAFYVPFGWPLLTLARRLRRPPCGVRGLSRAARRALGGEHLWRLAERPLPPR